MRVRLLTIFLAVVRFTFSSLIGEAQERVTLQFVGDLMQHGTQVRSALQSNGTFLYDTCFAYLSPRLQNTDWVVANIETTFAGEPYTGYPLFSSPNVLATAIRDAGFNIFLTANNHILDKGLRGVKGTLNLFDSLGVRHRGTSYKGQPSGPLILEKNGIRIALLNYTYGTNGNYLPPDVTVSSLDSLLIKKDLEEARAKQVDYTILCVHWGNEYQNKPSAYQREWAQRFKRWGVNAVVGSHPHVVQGIEIERDSLGSVSFFSAYSLGNFISNQPDDDTRMGLLLGFSLVKKDGRTYMDNPYYEWLWTWRPIKNGKKTYHVLPISDSTLFATMTQNPPDPSEFASILKQLRSFMLTQAPQVPERTHFSTHERKNLYFGEHPSLCPLWTQQPVFTLIDSELPPIKNCSSGRAD